MFFGENYQRDGNILQIGKKRGKISKKTEVARQAGRRLATAEQINSYCLL